MKREKLPSHRQAVIMSILINGKKYGREIRNEYESLTGQKMPLGSLYTTFMRMEMYGFIRSWLGESTNERGGNRRKYFEIKAAGERALDAFDLFVKTAITGRLRNA